MTAISDIGAEVLGAMVNAIVAGYSPKDTAKGSRIEHLQYIMRNANKLTAEQKHGCASMVIISQFGGTVKPCGEGILINLDALPDDVLEKMVTFIENGLRRSD